MGFQSKNKFCGKHQVLNMVYSSGMKIVKIKTEWISAKNNRRQLFQQKTAISFHTDQTLNPT